MLSKVLLKFVCFGEEIHCSLGGDLLKHPVRLAKETEVSNGHESNKKYRLSSPHTNYRVELLDRESEGPRRAMVRPASSRPPLPTSSPSPQPHTYGHNSQPTMTARRRHAF